MDPSRRGFSSSVNGIQLGNRPFSILSDHNLVAGAKFENSLFDRSFREVRYLKPDPTSANTASGGLSVSPEEDDCDFSDEVLKYINQMLMEEDMEDQTYMLQQSLDLQAAEKSFYEVLGKKYPPSPDHNLSFADQSYESPDDNFPGNNSNYISSSSTSSGNLADNCWIQSPSDCNTSQVQASPFSSSNSVVSTMDGLVDSPNSTLQLPDLYNESQSVWQFQKGVEEASKFLPSGNELFFNLEVKASLPQGLKGGNNEVVVKSELKDEEEHSPSGSRVRKNPQREDIGLEEERSTKQAAVYTESTLRSEMFDLVLLCNRNKCKPHSSTPHEALQNETSSNLQQQNGQVKGSNGGKGRGKKQSGKKEVVDLRTLLIQCAQAVAADDRRSANELLKQVRQHSSPFGDGNQRLAHCFADGLEARLAGTGSQIYKGLISKGRSAADILKAYHLYVSVCPFRKMSNFFSNRSIMIRAEKATRLHIIDFGILYGFQWPTFIQRLSSRPGGPPKLRITGIEFPQPGFRPAERIEETGRRLANYAASFDVPFEYNAIAKKWETIQLEELQIDRDELLVVNCLYRFETLLDETVAVDSPRNIVLNMIKKIRPDIFIQGIVNGSYNAPFFVTRFREALFHFSAQFDMLETTVLRENWERMLIEREIFGREALNVIACEGWERVERPETYKQWQLRNLRAGFVQLPLNREIMERATERVTTNYHKDFVIDEDSQWMLQGWKGRIIYALSAWKPA